LAGLLPLGLAFDRAHRLFARFGIERSHTPIRNLVRVGVVAISFAQLDCKDSTDSANRPKTVGFVILMLSLVRLSWRFYSPPPPLPLHMPRWERLTARISHALFYILLIALPLTCWGYVWTDPPHKRAALYL